MTSKRPLRMRTDFGFFQVGFFAVLRLAVLRFAVLRFVFFFAYFLRHAGEPNFKSHGRFLLFLFGAFQGALKPSAFLVRANGKTLMNSGNPHQEHARDSDSRSQPTRQRTCE